MDRGNIDFARLHAFTLSLAFFVVRTKENVLLQRRYSNPVDKEAGVRSDQTVVLKAVGSATAVPDALRRVSYFDATTGKRLVFLTNNFTLPALTIAQIYKQRWQVEMFRSVAVCACRLPAIRRKTCPPFKLAGFPLMSTSLGFGFPPC